MGSLSATGFSSSNVALWTGNLDLRLATNLSTSLPPRFTSAAVRVRRRHRTRRSPSRSRFPCSRLAAGSIARHGFGDARAKALQRQRAGAL
jgi:hypothetical protein